MTEWLLDVFVPGRPAPQGSVRAIVNRHTGRAAVVKDNKIAQKSWRQDVRDAAQAAWGDRPPIDGPVETRIDFVMPRPASTPKRSTPPAIKKPDGDKLERAVWDALTHVVWTDDSRVTHWAGSKRIAEIGQTPGARIRVREATPVDSARSEVAYARVGDANGGGVIENPAQVVPGGGCAAPAVDRWRKTPSQARPDQSPMLPLGEGEQ